MSFTDKWENDVLNYLFAGQDMGLPTNLYVGLHVGSGTPNDAGGNIEEPSGNGYSRVEVVRNGTNFPQTSNGTISNGAEIVFPQASGEWGTATHFVIYDAQTGGNALVVGEISTPKAITDGDTVSFGAGGMSFTLS